MRALLTSPILLSVGLLLLSVIIHALVIGKLNLWYSALEPRAKPTYGAGVRLLMFVAVPIVFAHLAEIGAWATAYVMVGALPDFNQAFYFSGITYTTVGFGDVVLPGAWKEMAAFEGLTGILMAGWSTAFLFAVLNRMISYGHRLRQGPGEGSE